MTEDQKALWHGRFAAGPDEALLALSNEQHSDMKLAEYDIAGSRAHVRGLVRTELLTVDEGNALDNGLAQVLDEVRNGKFAISIGDEDIHMAVERRLSDLVGDVGGKLHTARSRNDQSATDLRLYVKAEIESITHAIIGLQYVLLELATQAGNTYLPGYTHLQRAQPVLLAHHFAAHAWALSRDVDRFIQSSERADVSPLGAGALAGTSLPIDPAGTAADLGFSQAFHNSLDATSDRDFVVEALFDIALTGVHVSRMAEEMILWNSEEFSFMKLSDAFSTGSSMMPQKKNPDVAELSRGKAGSFIGHLTGVLATLKGLPLAYNRDLQTTKVPLFTAVDDIRYVLVAMAGALQTATFNTVQMQAAADNSAAAATDLAEWLVQKGMPFRQAHEVVGTAVGVSTREGKSFFDVVAEDSQLGPEAAALLAPGVSVQRRTSPGAAGPDPVTKQLEALFAHIRADEARLATL